MSLKNKIKNVRAVRFLYSLWENRKDENFIRHIVYANKNPDILYVKPADNNTANVNDAVYVIDSFGKNDGLFALLRWTLDGLYYAKQHGLKASVMWSDKVLCADSEYPVDVDPFEYYFVQPSGIKACDVSAYPTLRNQGGARSYTESLNGSSPGYKYSDEFTDAFAETVRACLKFNEKTQRTADECIASRGVNEDVLGVHIRGTDFKSNYRNHPVYISPADYYEYIDKAIDECGFKKIYLATDDKSILDEMIGHYGTDKIIYGKDVKRGDGVEGVHVNPSSPYQAGLDVICDMGCLANCGGIISGLSHVSFFARVFRMSTGAQYKVDVKIDKGVNTKGKKYKAPKK